MVQAVIRVDDLGELASALERFAPKALEAVDETEARLAYARSQLEEKKAELENELQELEEAGSDRDNPEGDKDRENFSCRIRKAQEALEAIERKIARFEDQVRDFEHIAPRVRELATDEKSRDISALHRLIEVLSAVGSVHTVGGGISPRTSTHVSKQTGGGVFHPEKLPLPEKFEWVLLNQIDMSEVPADLPFTKLEVVGGREEVKRGFETLKTQVLPAFAEDPKRNLDYFINLDKKNGQGYPGPTAKVYEAFFKDPTKGSPIALQPGKTPGLLTVIDGRHRISVARELGWTAVPAIKIGPASPREEKRTSSEKERHARTLDLRSDRSRPS